MSALDTTNAHALLSELIGRELRTLTGSANRILRLEGGDVFVATGRSPSGTAVPVTLVQHALDQLRATGELRIDVPTVGYRSAFIGAVLREVPNVAVLSSPQRLVLEPGSAETDS